ncbi:hypothetical protein [Wolbachia endosymbiont of Folsomia candida]|uniref:hypothetical protein n=1 Tax=Wolbachia endosymbiont of Folsomia candida TaxID=169402 RepID=UPI000A7197B4|nr:hypothetical protein [Wolbachia endosymbiont of Folsomia candida]APR98416.1 hypothetical protein ASM33_03990 [Wolbachia endosymbiont of Folsomia candida]
MTSITNSFKDWFSSKSEMEDFFRDFWPAVDKEVKKEELEEELLTLKKRELYRQYASLATMVPFAAFMAVELTSMYSEWVLLSTIGCALSYAILPFMALSIMCILYLIYNNRKIAQKEQELRDLENGKIAEEAGKDVPYNIGDYMNCADAVLTILVIVASIVSETLEESMIGDAAFLTSNLFNFITSAAFCYSEYQKSKEYEAEKGEGEGKHIDSDEKSEKTTNNMPAAQLMLAGSSIMLIKRIMLMALASSLNPAFGLALGFIGTALLIVGHALIIHSYSKELTDVKVSGKGTSLGLGSVSSNTRGGYTPTEVGGIGAI